VHIGLGGEHGAQAVAYNGVIIHEQNGDGAQAGHLVEGSVLDHSISAAKQPLRYSQRPAAGHTAIEENTAGKTTGATALR
jgi:hypothetical protein